MGAHNFVDYFFRRINGATRVSFDANLDRTSGEGTYLFANGLPIGMATPGDCQGVKMEFDYGVTPDVTGAGKGVVGLDIKMTMDQDWDFGSNQYNATVRAARLQVVSEDDVSGRIEGAYINAIAEGDKAIEGYISGLTGPGIIGVEARTEIQTSATIETPSAVGVLIFSRVKASATLTGKYRGLQIEMPMLGSAASISDTTCAIYVGADWGGANKFDYGLYMTSGTCLQAIYGRVALASASEIETYHFSGSDIRTTFTTAMTTGKYLYCGNVSVIGNANIDSGASVFAFAIGVEGTGINSGRLTMLRMAVSSGNLFPNQYITFQSASPGVTYLFQIVGNYHPWANGGTDCTASGATNPAGTIAIKDPLGATGYIRVWAAK